MSKFKVVITDFGDPGEDLERAEIEGSGLDIEFIRLNTRKPEEIIPVAADADGLLVQWAEMTPPVIEKLERCKVISRYGIGVNNVDLKAAGEHGIRVCNVPDYCIEEVSTTAISFLLCLNRHIKIQDQRLHGGGWGTAGESAPIRLSSQVLGILGLGQIGAATAARAKALGVSVIAFDPYCPKEKAAQLGVELTSFDALLERSDYLALHCPLNQETRHIISAPQLAKMKSTAYLINMARGPVVDQPALIQALQKGTIAGAALDVFEDEPLPVTDPLRQMDNVLLTPHTSSWSAQSIEQLRRDTARNVVIVLQGKTARNVVNRNELKNPR